jgi:L-ascorbate metabolism protein UlaG (beta-lactamase superfamily)
LVLRLARLRWLGHAAWEIELDGKTIFVDPYLTDNPSAAIKAEEVSKADLVFVTHDHYDHVGDAFDLAKRFDAVFVAMYELAVKAEQNGVKKTMGVNIGGTVKIGSLTVAVTTAIHSGNPCGYVFMGKNASIYHSGDTGLFESMQRIGQLYKPKIALLPIGGHFTMGPVEAAVAVSMLKPKVVIPMHYNTWDPIKQDPKEFEKLVKRKTRGTKVVILNPGQTYQYPAGRST